MFEAKTFGERARNCRRIERWFLSSNVVAQLAMSDLATLFVACLTWAFIIRGERQLAL